MKMKDIAAEAVKEVDAANIEACKEKIISLYKQMKAAEKVFKMLQHKYYLLLEEEV